MPNMYNNMNESWHIPRASLAGSSASSSSNSSNKSYSNPSTVARNSRYLNQEGQTNLAYNHTSDSYSSSNSRNSNQRLNDRNSRRSHQNKSSEEIFTSDKLKKSNQNKNLNRSINNNDNNGKNGGIKRGSRSSQGSTDSNNSTHSASSGSLLLTAANLERFAAIHKKQHKLSEISENRQNYNTNITISQQQQQQQQQTLQQNSPTTISTITTTPIKASDINTSDSTVIEIDPNLHFVKTKDVDSVSIASSTHFTMVNGVSGPQRNKKEGLCSRGHQVTVLIVSMSFFFLIGISTMVYLLEMRAREMPMN